MKTNHKKFRKQLRTKNKDRVNRQIEQQEVFAASPIFIITLISLKLNELTTPEKLLARLRMHVEKLTGNANFAVTDPTVAEVQTMADDLEALIDAVNSGNNAQIPVRDEKVKEAEEMVRQLSYNIQYLSHGDEVEIKSSGYDVRKTPGTSQQPGQITGLVATPVGPGKIKLKWDKESHSRVYAIEQFSNVVVPPNQDSWDAIGKTRNISFVIENLNPGQVYTFRVYGTNGNDDGNPSDPVEQRSL